MIDPISKFIMDNLLDSTAHAVMPIMFATFILGVAMRWLIFYTARMEHNFAREFEKRARNHFTDPQAPKIDSFYPLLKRVMEKTYHEVFELRHRYKRRNFDHVTTMTDRLFLIQDGVQRLMADTLRRARYLKKDGYPPQMVEVTKGVFETNPVFTRLLGIFPTSLAHELVNILPGLFIIGGIFGTFLGIAKGLPELGGMDLSNIEETKRTMDFFLAKISQSMIKSIVGIGLSVAMSLINTVFAPEGTYYNVINRFAAALDLLWNETKVNEYHPSMDVPVAPPATPPAAASAPTTTGQPPTERRAA